MFSKSLHIARRVFATRRRFNSPCASTGSLYTRRLNLSLRAVLVLTTMVATSLISAQEANIWEYEGLSGIVRSIKEFEADGTLISSVGYQANGRASSYRSFDSSGSVSMVVDRSYDPSDGSVSFYSVPTSGPSTVGSLSRTFDEYGNMIVEESSSFTSGRDPYFGKTTYTYDQHGRLVEEHRYYTRASIQQTSVYYYDDGPGELASLLGESIEVPQFPYREDIYRADGTLSGYSLMLHDIYGNKIESETYSPDGSLTSRTKWEFEYDQWNNWIRQTEYQWVEALDRFENSGRITERAIDYY